MSLHLCTHTVFFGVVRKVLFCRITAIFYCLGVVWGRGLPRPLPVKCCFALVLSVCLSVKQRATLLRGA